MEKKKVVVGMSGGVDSSVAAYLLKKQGYDVIGITMQVWQDDEGYTEREGGCCSLSAVEDARMVAKSLNIPFYVINFKDFFKEKVIDYFIDEYLDGKTPNPCIACNKYVKFEELLRRAQSLGADYVATGHYAKIYEEGGRFQLERAVDDKKDQTYALYTLTQEQLKRTLMPCGDYTKPEIRQIAEEIGLITANKRDSQDICFVSDNDHGKYVYSMVPQKKNPGNFVTLSGKVVGKHKGIAFYTIGQRKGLGLALGTPVFVIGINKEKNEVIVGTDEDLRSNTLTVKDVNLISIEELKEPLRVQAKIRYAAKPADCTIYPLEDGRIKAVFDEKQRAITLGQSCVFYDGLKVLGGGIIDSTREE